MSTGASLEVFLFNARADGTPLDRSRAIEILARDAYDPSDLGFIEYHKGEGAGEVIGWDDDEIDVLSFQHFGGRTFLERLFELAERLDGILIWAGHEEGTVHMGVTKESLLAQIPDDLRQDCEIAVIKGVDHLNELLGGDKMMPEAEFETVH